MSKRLPMLQTPVPGRICWSCRHVQFFQGSPDYSEYTPGSDFQLYCGKQYWEFDSHRDELSDFRTKLRSAEQCADFEPHSSEA